MNSGGNPHDRSAEVVFRDFKGRRAGIIKALTTEREDFYEKCDPAKENLCLYAYANEQWEVSLPVEEVPPVIPEPVLGINFSRDGMIPKDWLLLIAAHSDSWLLSTAFYFGNKFGFDRAERNRLFSLINDMPTIFETVEKFMSEQTKEESSGKKPSSNNNKSKSGSKRGSRKYHESDNSEDEEEEEGSVEEEEDEQDENTVCGKCNKLYSTNEFWICCDICETWFHGKCVKITQSKAAHIEQYKCPSCSKKPRH